MSHDMQRGNPLDKPMDDLSSEDLGYVIDAWEKIRNKAQSDVDLYDEILTNLRKEKEERDSNA